jgi:hypothetical protein
MAPAEIAEGKKNQRLPKRMPISKLASKTPSNMEGQSWVCCHRRQSLWIPGFQTWSLPHSRQHRKISWEASLPQAYLMSRYLEVYNHAKLRFWNMLSQVPGSDIHPALPCLGWISGWRKQGALKGPRSLLILNGEVKHLSSASSGSFSMALPNCVQATEKSRPFLFNQQLFKTLVAEVIWCHQQSPWQLH